jgi:uncharacterized membrane protein
VLGGAALGLHLVLFQGALTLTSVASTVTLTTMSPLFVALGGWWLLGERTTRRAWQGMVVTVARGAGDRHRGRHRRPRRGRCPGRRRDGAGCRGRRQRLPAGRSGGPTGHPDQRVRRDGLRRRRAGAAPGLPGHGDPLTGYSDRTTWLAIAGIVIGPQLLGHTVFNLLLQVLPATTVAVAILAEPVGAGLLAWLVLGELPPALFALGAPLVLLGVARVIRADATDRGIRTPTGG